MPRQGKHLTEPYVQWVEAEMAERGWKAAELARRAKMNQGAISRMLRREVAPDALTLERLAKAFGKPLPVLRLAPEPGRPPGGGRAARSTPSNQAEMLGAEEIAEEVGEVLEPLIKLLAGKGGTIAARWLLAVAAEANDQGVTDVRPLIDLARELLWRAERVE